MVNKDEEVSAYIEGASAYAKPILNRLRKLVHQSCPEVAETIKWGMPFFEYKGMMCHMAAFKKHCAFGFWKSSQVLGEQALREEKDGMGQFGRLTSVADLPEDRVIVEYIKKAMALNEGGVKKEIPRSNPPKKAAAMPHYFRTALAARPNAARNFETFSNTHKREYIEWLTEAKQEATRARRLDSAIEMIESGQSRHAKYRRREPVER